MKLKYIFLTFTLLASCSNLLAQDSDLDNIFEVGVSGVHGEYGLDVDKASDIFVAQITKAEIVESDSPQLSKEVQATYLLLESLKGSQEEIGIIKSTLSMTGLSYTVGQRYLIVLYDSQYVNNLRGSGVLYQYEFEDSFDGRLLEAIREKVND
jgi:hypothetical protein